jgi:hypothetical protein
MNAQKFIEKLTFQQIAELILNAKSEVIFSSINIHNEVAIPLAEASKRDVSVKVIIDTDEENYRNGYGELKSIDLLKSNGVKIFEVKGNSISFLIVDDSGYFIFHQSLIFKSDATGPNAILMDNTTRLKLLTHYFPPNSKKEKEELINEAIDLQKSSQIDINNIINDLETGKKDVELVGLDEKQLEKTRESLKLNPALQPDLKRRINTYTAKIQFVELNFIGSNFHTAKVNIPNRALPFHDAELKKSLEAKLNLFDNIEENHDFEKFNQIKQMVETLRSRQVHVENQVAILIPISCRNKSVIHTSNKEKLFEKLDEIKKAIQAYQQSTLEDLEKEILRRKKAIKKELSDFLKANPPEEYRKYSQPLLFEKVDDSVQQIVAKIKFPDVHKLISELKLKYNFYDLTFEDFRDDELIKEFREKKILKGEELDDIVSIKDAFEAAK